MEPVNERVHIAALLPADSPRVNGEDERHTRVLSEVDIELPPIVVHRQTMRVIDGMHRLRAALARGERTIEARFFNGTTEDAFVLSVELNSGTGLPLSATDRAAAASRIIASHPHWSDRWIAEVAGVATRTVRALRRRATGDEQRLNTRVGRDGRVRPLSSAAGRRRAMAVLADRPSASLREIAREAGIAVGTARDVRERFLRGDDPVPAQQRRAAPEPAPGLPVVPPRKTPALAHLRADPSLRFTELGRTLLRLLDAHSRGSDEWDRLAGAVPAHCAESVAEAAQACADAWHYFAGQVSRPDRRAG
ncbi:ParB/RepB/Spo0J family partition protein [Saccharothrix sp. SC076]|nr:ParB/RepB/Spo0J family partition protein [Saccharothrix obliqua]